MCGWMKTLFSGGLGCPSVATHCGCLSMSEAVCWSEHCERPCGACPRPTRSPMRTSGLNTWKANRWPSSCDDLQPEEPATPCIRNCVGDSDFGLTRSFIVQVSRGVRFRASPSTFVSSGWTIALALGQNGRWVPMCWPRKGSEKRGFDVYGPGQIESFRQRAHERLLRSAIEHSMVESSAGDLMVLI